MWFDQYSESLSQAILATWTEVPEKQVFLDTQSTRIDWQKLYNAGQISGAFVIVEFTIAAATDWGVGQPRYEVTAGISYIRPIAGVTSGITGYLIDRADTIRKALYTAAGLGTVMDDMPINADSKNEINAALLSAQTPWQAVTVSPTFVWITS